MNVRSRGENATGRGRRVRETWNRAGTGAARWHATTRQNSVTERTGEVEEHRAAGTAHLPAILPPELLPQSFKPQFFKTALQPHPALTRHHPGGQPVSPWGAHRTCQDRTRRRPSPATERSTVWMPLSRGSIGGPCRPCAEHGPHRRDVGNSLNARDQDSRRPDPVRSGLAAGEKRGQWGWSRRGEAQSYQASSFQAAGHTR